MARRMKAAAETGDINGLYESIKEDPNVLDSIDAIPFVDTPLHTAASAGHTDFGVEILRLKPSFGRKLNPDGLSSLHLALINHKFDTVRRLIKLDKELIRVKGKQGETPLHFIVKKEDINADQQQQRVLDDHRVNTLADFLFACPNSIKDLTNRDENVLHIAVRTKNISAVEIICGLIRRINKGGLLANKDDKGNTAMDLVLDLQVENSRLEASNSLQRSVRALEYSSGDENDYALAKFLNSPERRLEVLYKQKFFMGRSGTMDLRNIGLVVAALIATATFTCVLSPPGGVRDFNLLTDGGDFNATVTSTKNLFAANTSFFNATLSINPVKPLLSDPTFFNLFYGFNTVAFVLSAAMIMFVLPGIFWVLHLALGYMMCTYATSFYLIAPSIGYCVMYATGLALCAGLVYYSRLMTFAIEEIAKGNRRVPFYLSKLQGERLMMLNNLLGNIN